MMDKFKVGEYYRFSGGGWLDTDVTFMVSEITCDGTFLISNINFINGYTEDSFAAWSSRYTDSHYFTMSSRVYSFSVLYNVDKNLI